MDKIIQFSFVGL